jgi:ATP-dependent Clp protease protease subunit
MASTFSRLSRAVRTLGASLAGGSAYALAEADKHKRFAKSSNELFYDVLPRQRAIYLSGPIDDVSAKLIIGQLLALEFQDPGKPITLFISSLGGKVYSGLGIIDVMDFISSPVRTVCIGHCESMGAIILASGEPGERYALPHARIMLHQPFARLGDVKRTADDVQLHALELTKTRSTLLEMVTRATGKTSEEVGFVFDRDSYFTAAEAVELGVIDRVANRLDQIDPSLAKPVTTEEPVQPEQPAGSGGG